MIQKVSFGLSRAFYAAVAVMLLTATTAQAELLIRVTEGADSAIPLSVVPFSESGSMPTGTSWAALFRPIWP